MACQTGQGIHAALQIIITVSIKHVMYSIVSKRRIFCQHLTVQSSLTDEQWNAISLIASSKLVIYDVTLTHNYY